MSLLTGQSCPEYLRPDRWSCLHRMVSASTMFGDEACLTTPAVLLRLASFLPIWYGLLARGKYEKPQLPKGRRSTISSPSMRPRGYSSSLPRGRLGSRERVWKASSVMKIVGKAESLAPAALKHRHWKGAQHCLQGRRSRPPSPQGHRIRNSLGNTKGALLRR